MEDTRSSREKATDALEEIKAKKFATIRRMGSSWHVSVDGTVIARLKTKIGAVKKVKEINSKGCLEKEDTK